MNNKNGIDSLIDFEDNALLAAHFINNTNKSIFLTGKAGTGKTTFLKNIVKATYKKTIVCAPTGIAALNAGGVTIHSQFKLPPCTFLPINSLFEHPGSLRIETKESLKRHFQMSGERRKILQQTELIIIDEVSMLRCDLLDAMDLLLKYVRRNQRPFGGVQMLFIGDLLQLPPVVKREEWALLSKYYDSQFFFSAQVLKQEAPVYIELDKIYRQSDKNFTSILNKLRYNELDFDDIEILNSYYNATFRPEEGDSYITLTTHNKSAEEKNQKELEKINESLMFYNAKIEKEFPESMFPVEKELKLKLGAQVMMVKNDTSGFGRFFNGKIGTVELLTTNDIKVVFADGKFVMVELYLWENIKYTINPETNEMTEEILGSFQQYPLKLAWAITIHKSQGLTFEKAIIDVKNVFASGQAYVALSRLKSLDGLVLSAPIQGRIAFEEASVTQFEETQSQQGHLEDILEDERLQSLIENTQKAFDFSAIKTAITKFSILLSKDEKKKELKDWHPWIEKLNDEVFTLNKVGSDFSDRIRYFLSRNPMDAVHIQERLESSQKYFDPIFKRMIVDMVELAGKPSKKAKMDAYIKEVDNLDSLIMDSLRKIHRMVLEFDCFTKKELLTSVRWKDTFNLSWRIGLKYKKK